MLLFLTTVIIAQTQEQKERYSKLDNAMKGAGGYDWEPHTVETDDGWFITMFRITGANGKKFPKAEENKDKPPILI